MSTDHLADIARSRFDASIAAAQSFFEREVDAVSLAALEMARRFSAGGRLLVFGTGADSTDAQHVSVEFLHPVIVGKRALPAIALTNDFGTTTAGGSRPFYDMLKTLARPGDIAMGIAGTCSVPVRDALETAGVLGMLTISIENGEETSAWRTPPAHRFVLSGADSLIAQETGETLYHVLWELVHLFLEQGPRDAGPALAPGAA